MPSEPVVQKEQYDAFHETHAMLRERGVNTVALVKGTSLVATISVVELTYTAQRFIGSTYKPFEIFGVAALLYMVMIYGVARVVDLLDRRYAID